MFRKTLIALSAAAALGVSSGAMAASHGGHGASSGSSGAMQGHSGGGMQGPGRSGIGPSAPGPVGTTMGPSQVRPMGPSGVTSQLRPTGPSNWHGRHHHRHDRFFFGVGFAGPYYDYGYDSCWRIVPNYYGGWQRVWVCGDYPYGGYYGGY